MKLLSRASVASKLDISVKTLMSWVREGAFPPPTHRLPDQSPDRWAAAVVEMWQSTYQVTGEIQEEEPDEGSIPGVPVKVKPPRKTRENPGKIDPREG